MTTNFSSAVSGGIRLFLELLRRILLPHLAAGLMLFILTAYLAYRRIYVPSVLPSALKGIMTGAITGVYGVVIFGYVLLAACVYAITVACGYWEDFTAQMLDAVKEKMIEKLPDTADGIAKKQARVALNGSVREVFTAAKHQSFGKGVALIGMGALLLAVRAVLAARLRKWPGAVIHTSQLFAGQAVLVGAVFLNLRLFSLMLLGLIYAGGAVMAGLLLYGLW